MIGAGLLGAAGYLTIDTRRFVAAAATAQGEVIDVIASQDSDDDVVYRPRVRFRTADGRDQEFTSTIGSKPAGFYVGEVIEVMYDPARPSDAHINSFFQLWFAPLVLGGMGTTFVILSLFGIFGGAQLRYEIPKPAPAEPPHSSAGSDTAQARSESADRGPVVDRLDRD
ncbi:MAG: DUF3592 domain-containing protein [Dongiaceae bacterium]